MYRKEKRIPTILALFLLIGGIGTAVYLDQNRQSLSSLASLTSVPEDIHISNITDNSFTVSFLTAGTSTGRVVVSNNTQKLTFLDDLDSDNIPRPRKTHYVTVKNLSENEKYSVRIISNEKCPDDRYCPTITQKTGMKIASILDLPPARGSVFKEKEVPAEGTIVYFQIGKSPLLSGRADSSGLWVIPLGNLRTEDLAQRPQLGDADLIQLTAKLAPSETATAVIDVKSIKQNLTIPKMTIGNSYNFTELISKKDLLAKIENQNQNILGTNTQNFSPSTKSGNTSPEALKIIFPEKDQDTTPDTRPRIRGSGAPGSQLLITVNSTPQTGRIIVGKDGLWVWRPTKELPPGKHTLSIQGYDENGNLFTQTRNFIVLKSGESVLGESTPSASLTPTTAAAGGTSTPTPSATTPIPTASRTPTPIASPTSAVITTITIPPSVPPRSGATQPGIFLIGGGLSLLFAGAILFLLP